MWLRRLVLTSLLLFASTLLSSCWDQYELRDLSVVTGLGIDIMSDDTVRLTLQVINPSELAAQEEGTGRSGAQNYETFAPSIQEAFRKLTQTAPRRGYYSHLASVVIGEEAAKKGLNNYLDHFYRDHEIRTDFPIIIARGYDAKEILSITPPIEDITSIHIMDSIIYSENSYSLVTETTLDDLFEMIVASGIDPSLNGITIIGDEEVGQSLENVEEALPKAFLEIGNSAFFKEDKLIGWLSEDETKGYQYLTNAVQDTSETLPCPHGQDNYFTVETTSIDTSITVTSNGSLPNVVIKPYVQGTISEINCDQLDVLSPSTHKFVIETFEQRIEDLVGETIAKAQEEHSDYTGIGREVYRQEPHIWHNIKNHWYETFESLNITVDAKVEVKESGDVNNTFNIEDYKHD
ncbi:Ger(x)C family spore germination protein [Geomicrobium sediminis]|uniref:Spore germination protein KC n=1 Tax=Geomicrobium sediminis TaxID=1347788 RepID=A0ABS2P9K9_9BACL|nr:Ger(x)C family spore germination protein [Geomicrobium sediminis]MBM7631997.1 spore germination protein KC [Geomicrobium sediminis]